MNFIESKNELFPEWVFLKSQVVRSTVYAGITTCVTINGPIADRGRSGIGLRLLANLY